MGRPPICSGGEGILLVNGGPRRAAAGTTPTMVTIAAVVSSVGHNFLDTIYLYEVKRPIRRVL